MFKKSFTKQLLFCLLYTSHPADKEHAFPVVIGGGYSLKNATVMVLEKRGNKMTLTVKNAEGKELLKLTF